MCTFIGRITQTLQREACWEYSKKGVKKISFYLLQFRRFHKIKMVPEEKQCDKWIVDWRHARFFKACVKSGSAFWKLDLYGLFISWGFLCFKVTKKYFLLIHTQLFIRLGCLDGQLSTNSICFSTNISFSFNPYGFSYCPFCKDIDKY